MMLMPSTIGVMNITYYLCVHNSLNKLAFPLINYNNADKMYLMQTTCIYL